MTGGDGLIEYPHDATPGQRGAAIYGYIDGVAVVFGVHERGGSPNRPGEPAEPSVGVRITPAVYNDLCWMMRVVGPSRYASHPCAD